MFCHPYSVSGQQTASYILWIQSPCEHSMRHSLCRGTLSLNGDRIYRLWKNFNVPPFPINPDNLLFRQGSIRIQNCQPVFYGKKVFRTSTAFAVSAVNLFDVEMAVLIPVLNLAARFAIAMVSSPCFCLNVEIVLGEENQLSNRLLSMMNTSFLLCAVNGFIKSLTILAESKVVKRCQLVFVLLRNR